MAPKVSIIILTFNRVNVSAQYIPQLVSKVGAIEHEILIWDNGSEDGSHAWAAKYARKHAHIKVFKGETNLGMEAINNLASRASGEYILKVDDDIEVPASFASRIVAAYEKVNEEKLLFLGWDMPWTRTPRSGGDTFATRSGMKLYKEPQGKIVMVNPKERVLINYNPRMWMVNGACRLSPRETFLKVGGHPQGIIYGVDKHISRIAAQHGYWIGFFNSFDLLRHCGTKDTKAYRNMKNEELKKVGSPFHV